MSSRKGFTLIELVLVIAIIAILAAVIAPRFMSQMPKAKISATKANLENMRSALGVYIAEGNKWPTNPTALKAALVPKYMRAIPYETISDTKSNMIGGCGGNAGWCYRQLSATDWEIYLNKAGADVLGEAYSNY